MKIKLFSIICLILSISVLLTGCGDDGLLLRSRERTILKSDYDENYNHYEDELEVEKSASTINVSGNVTSGSIELRLVEKDKDGNTARTYEYTISDTLGETIELTKNHSQNWLIIADFDEKSNGNYRIEVIG